MNIAGIIPAAGAGHFTKDGKKFSKLLAKVGGLPVLHHVVRSLKDSATCSRIVVSIGPLFGEEIKASLFKGRFRDLSYVKHHWRLGTAEVLSRAIGSLPGYDLGVMIFGDMLFVKPETINHLVSVHLKEMPSITMLTIPIRKNHPLAKSFSQYGVVKRDSKGQICGTIERRIVGSMDDLPDGECINPSVFVIDLRWADKTLPLVHHTPKGDKFPDEFYITELLAIANQLGDRVVEVSLEIPEQAIQVNTLEDLKVARQILGS